jgi:hypothetical protein
MLERIKAFFRKLFAKFEKPSEAAKPHQTVQPPYLPPIDVFPSKQQVYEAWRNSHPPTTRAYIPTWEQHLKRPSIIASPVLDTGYDLGEGNAKPKVNPVTAGVPVGPYRVVVKAGAHRPRVAFTGAPGAFFEKLSYELKNEAGQVVQSAPNVPGAIVKEVFLSGQGVHYLTVTVDGSGPLAAQFQQ